MSELVRFSLCHILRIEALDTVTRLSRHENVLVQTAEASLLNGLDITGTSLSSIALLLTAF